VTDFQLWYALQTIGRLSKVPAVTTAAATPKKS
jgi:carboxyl-terminal processing protease